MEEKKIVLINEKKDCCACGACMNICPKEAISMRDDEYGFVYPKIDYSRCVSCGKCTGICNYKRPLLNEIPQTVYAAAVRDAEILKKSSSGGIFACIARNVLDKSGIVFGAALIYENGQLVSRHISIDNINDLYKLQGSKYVQSAIGNTYKEAKAYLKNGKPVLFSGTPCQIAGLNSYLGTEYPELITVDIICHGVPSEKLFRDYIAYEEKKYNINIIDFSFRDKSKRRSMMNSSTYTNSFTYTDNKNNITKKRIFNGKVKSSYTALFLTSLTYRENCYQCIFAQRKRASDITLGDFWGFHSEHPEIGNTYGLSNGKGVSCILLNTDKGKKCIDEIRSGLVLLDSELDKVSKHNAQLNHPSILSKKRDEILKVYAREGYGGIDRYYKVNFRKYRMVETVVGMIPKSIKRYIQKKGIQK